MSIETEYVNCDICGGNNNRILSSVSLLQRLIKHP